jgi:hypothetical protein
VSHIRAVDLSHAVTHAGIEHVKRTNACGACMHAITCVLHNQPEPMANESCGFVCSIGQLKRHREFVGKFHMPLLQFAIQQKNACRVTHVAFVKIPVVIFCCQFETATSFLIAIYRLENRTRIFYLNKKQQIHLLA